MRHAAFAEKAAEQEAAAEETMIKEAEIAALKETEVAALKKEAQQDVAVVNWAAEKEAAQVTSLTMTELSVLTHAPCEHLNPHTIKRCSSKSQLTETD